MFLSVIKEINRLISKQMPNISLKVTTEKNWHCQNFNFLSLNYLSLGQFLQSPNSRRYHWNLKHPVLTENNQRSGSKTVVFSIISILKGIMFSSQRVHAFCLNKNINFIKNETESKMENLTHSFREMNPVLQLIWESQIKSETVISWSM